MMPFRVTHAPIDTAAVRQEVVDSACGAYVQFDGWVRNHNEGQAVLRLEYEVYEPLALSEGEQVLREALQRFEIANAVAVHRGGLMEITEVAVVVAVSAAHRAAAFEAARYIIDQVKVRLPIWKKEHYANGTAEWVNCRHCAGAASHSRS
jgi:molybdopterin synthase catalytic subunit